MTELLPCPFCGNEENNGICWKSDNYVCVCCGSCGAEGANQEDEEEAIKSWNTRARLNHEAEFFQGCLYTKYAIKEAIDKLKTWEKPF